MAKLGARSRHMPENSTFDCHQALDEVNLQALVESFFPGRESLRHSGNLDVYVEVSKKVGRDLCWWYSIFKEAAPYVNAIDHEWCDIFNDPEFLVKNPGNEYLVNERDGTRRIKNQCLQEELFILLPRIFDDEEYKYTLLQSIRVNFETEFINAWRQRVGKWVIPLRPKGKPGPFYRDDGKWLSI